MTDHVNDHLRAIPFNNAGFGFRVAPRIVCADGFSLSAQAAEHMYCTPRQSRLDHYTHVEVGYPSERVEELMPYADGPDSPTETVYGYVPVEVVNAIIEAHGGPKEASE